MQKSKSLENHDKAFQAEKDFRTHIEEENREPLPIWCRGIMGGCVNCGGCV